jgi:dCMP deaminase
MIEKISWEQYALELAKVASLRSSDPWKKVGCCLLRHDNTVASLGYNGFPSGVSEFWEDRDERRKFVVHAEANALRYVKPGECRLIAITLLPCNDCFKTICSYGIKEIVYSEVYQRDNTTLELAEKLGVKLTQLPFLSIK